VLISFAFLLGRRGTIECALRFKAVNLFGSERNEI